eukprot:CAMPEP_0178972732 /NCGR_PEP_ID=MMETSP0789-20121207/21221_1 /TAXON_ID=3005 /ORGANISM="Rhizosolenia setigera, Strain CCMP 1694" /LENGTH=151 /DNA_ID=CAMNT_0020660301 /DNA_START=223 /DNA_END=678 /DNA_ORIENTATION=+
MLLGEAHIDTLETMHLLAETSLYAEDKESMLQDCFQRKKNSLGESHSSTLKTMRSLGLALYFQDKKVMALSTFQNCWELQRTKFGKNHPETLHTSHTFLQILQEVAKDNGEQEQHGEDLRRMYKECADRMQATNHVAADYAKRGFDSLTST